MSVEEQPELDKLQKRENGKKIREKGGKKRQQKAVLGHAGGSAPTVRASEQPHAA